MTAQEIEAKLKNKFEGDEYQKVQIIDYFEVQNNLGVQNDKGKKSFIEVALYLIDDYDFKEIGIVSFYRDNVDNEFEISNIEGTLNGKTIKYLKEIIEEE